MSWDSESDESCHSDSDDSSFVPSKASFGNGEDQIVRNTRNGRTGEAVVNRSKNVSLPWDSKSDESASEDSSFVPSKAPSRSGEDQTVRNTRNGRTGEARRQGRVRNGLIGRKRPRSMESLFSDLISDSEDIRPDPPHRHTDSEETVQDASAAPRRRGRPRTRREREREDSNCDDEERGHVRLTRKNAKVVKAVWTQEKTVRITYNQAVRHACINPIHGKAKASYSVLHLVRCTWKHNVKLMKETPSIAKSKPYQYTHKICEECMVKYGPHCFKCEPLDDSDIVPKLGTVFGEAAIMSVEDFTDAVRKWQQRRDGTEASYLVLHCTVIGPEARLLRRKFNLKRRTTVHVVYSDVRDRMEPAGSGQNLEESMFQHVWKTVMTERVHAQNQPLAAFFGNILLNDGVTFRDFRVNDLLVMYQPDVFVCSPLEADAMRASINTLWLARTDADDAAPSECCLRDAVVHSQREPRTVKDDELVLHGNLVASLLYRNARRQFGEKLCAEFEQRARLGEHLKLGEDGQKLPFRKLFAARGGEVPFRRVARATQDVASRDGDMRSRVCSVDTSGFELVCWTSRGAPRGGDFVIPGLMYKFETRSGSALVFRPRRYFHATLPASHRDLQNDKFAASFVTSI